MVPAASTAPRAGCWVGLSLPVAGRVARQRGGGVAGAGVRVLTRTSHPSRFAPPSPRGREDHFFAKYTASLRPHDVDQIPHGQVGVDQVQAPGGVHLAVRRHVAHDVVGARVGRHGVHVHLEIAEAVLLHALAGEQTRRRNERRRGVGLALHPFRRLGRGVGDLHIRRCGNSPWPRPPARQAGAGGDLGVVGRLAEQAVRRRRDVVAEAGVGDHASRLAGERQWNRRAGVFPLSIGRRVPIRMAEMSLA